MLQNILATKYSSIIHIHWLSVN